MLCIFSFLSFLDTLFLYMRSCDHLYTYIVLIFVLRGVLFLFEGCSEDAMYLFFSFFLRYIVLEHEVLWPFIDIHCFFHPLFHVLFLFSLYTYDSYYLYAIYYFFFTQRWLDEFCLKCFRNIGCQNLLAINSFLTKFFKSLC